MTVLKTVVITPKHLENRIQSFFYVKNIPLEKLSKSQLFALFGLNVIRVAYLSVSVCEMLKNIFGHTRVSDLCKNLLVFVHFFSSHK